MDFKLSGTRSTGIQKLRFNTLLTCIINGFLIKFLDGKSVKNVQRDPNTTEIWMSELFGKLSMSD